MIGCNVADRSIARCISAAVSPRARLALSSVMRDARSVLTRGPKPIAHGCLAATSPIDPAIARCRSAAATLTSCSLFFDARATRSSREDGPSERSPSWLMQPMTPIDPLRDAGQQQSRARLAVHVVCRAQRSLGPHVRTEAHHGWLQRRRRSTARCRSAAVTRASCSVVCRAQRSLGPHDRTEAHHGWLQRRRSIHCEMPMSSSHAHVLLALL